MNKILLLLALICIVAGARAQDRVFTYTYQSGVLNKGQKEIEVWSTLSGGRNNFYRGLDHKLEFEVGLGRKLQTSFYLNYGNSSAVVEDNGIQILSNSTDYSFSNEWKLKLSDPVANRIGSALYFEYSLAPTETALEGKLILDKQIGKFTHAVNFVGEYEIEHAFTPNGNRLKSEKEGEFTLEFNYGLSYKVKDHFSFGLEAMNQNQFSDSKLASSVLLAGPAFSYSTNGFWINLTCMPQITNLKGGKLELNDHERLQTRLIFSYEF
jgi:hypothetical protein